MRKILNRYIIKFIYIVLLLCSQSLYPIINNGNINVEIILPQNVQKEDALAGNFLAKRLTLLAQKGNIKVSWFANKTDRKAFSISLINKGILLSPLCSKREIDELKTIAIKSSKNSVEIYYPNSQSAQSAISTFLENFCELYEFAPEPLGLEFQKKINLRLPKGNFVFKRPFESFDFYGGDRKWFNQKGASPLKELTPHNAGRILDLKMMKQKPELYGKKLDKFGKLQPCRVFQPNFVNPDCAKFFIEQTNKFFLKNPLNIAFSVGMSDTDNYSQDSLTQSFKRGYSDDLENFSDLVYSFTNKIAKERPDKFIIQHAYRTTLDVPNFLLEKNILPFYSTDKSEWRLPDYKAKDITRMHAWSKTGIKHFAVWDYIYGSNYFLPNPQERFVFEGIEIASKLNAIHYFAESSPVWAFDAPKLWILTSKLNGDERSFEELKNFFFKTYYGNASSDMLKFHNLAEKIWTDRKTPERWLALYGSESQALLLNKNILNRMQSALKDAQKNVKGIKFRQRVKEVSLAFECSKLFCEEYWQKILLTQNLRNKENPEVILKSLETLKQLKESKLQALENWKNSSSFPFSSLRIWKRPEMSAPIDQAIIAVLESKNQNLISKLKDISDHNDILNAERFISKKDSPDLLIDGSFENAKFDIESKERKFPFGVMDTPLLKREFKTSPQATRTGKQGLFVKYAENSAISQSFKISEDSLCVFSGYIKGKFDAGTNIYASMIFTDINGMIIERKTLLIPSSPDKFSKFIIMAKSPQKASKLNVSLFCSYMKRNESVCIDDLSVQIIP